MTTEVVLWDIIIRDYGPIGVAVVVLWLKQRKIESVLSQVVDVLENQHDDVEIETDGGDGEG